MRKHHSLSSYLFALPLGFAILSLSASAQTTAPNEWTWIGGSSTVNQPGVYGTLKAPASGNVPGSRGGAVSWTDRRGNLWLFGGLAYDANGIIGYLNDLWEFDPITNEWTWMGGSSTVPCSGCGLPGTYGALRTPAIGNIPGGRSDSASWTDNNGNFWLFGGTGYDASGNSGYLNDLWEFNPSTNEWAWMGGSNLVGLGQPGVYGTVGIPAPGNIPMGRADAMSWVDSNGAFWLFGGTPFSSGESIIVYSLLNDLWEFNPTTNEWAWMGGNNSPSGNGGNPGIYGTLGTPAAGNIPGNRAGALSWTDSSGDLWLFGGTGDTSVYASEGILNDLWEFNSSTNEWAWMGGSSTVLCGTFVCGQPGSYGTQGMPAAGNIPSSRQDAASWTDGNGRMWTFGGNGEGPSGNYGELNDLWEFNPSTNEWAWMSGNSTTGSSNCTQPNFNGSVTCGRPGVYGTLETPAARNTPGGRGGATSWTDGRGNLWLFGGNGFDANGKDGSLNDLWEYQPLAPIPPDFIIAASPTSIMVTVGSNGSTSVSVTPEYGFNSAVSFSCTGLPAGASCSFAPATVTPPETTSTTLTVNSSAATVALHQNSNPLLPGAALVALLCGFGLRRRRRLQMLLLLAISIAGASLLNGCNNLPSVQPVTTTISVTALSGSLSHSTNISVTIN